MSSMTSSSSLPALMPKAPTQEMFPAGVGFYPEDKELVFHYLKRKVSDGENFRFIKELELYDHEPSKLPSLAHESGHSKSYFFARLQRSHLQGNRINRQVPGGFWRKTGSPAFINDEAGTRIATKTSLAYYKRDPTSDRSEKTGWLMKEYMLVESQPPHRNDKESDRMVMTPWTLSVVYLCKTLRKNRNGEK